MSHAVVYLDLRAFSGTNNPDFSGRFSGRVDGHATTPHTLPSQNASLTPTLRLCVNLKLRYSAPEAACREAIVSTLSNLQELCAEDKDLEEALRYAEVVPDGAGEPARISDLFDPAVVELPGLLAPEAFPAPEFCKPAVRLFYVCICVCVVTPLSGVVSKILLIAVRQGG